MASKFDLTDTVPAAPSGKINVKWQSDASGNVSAYVDPAGGGGLSFQTPWLSDIDGAGYDLNNLGVIRSSPDLGTTGPDVTIQNLAGTLHLLADTGGSIDIESVGTGRIMISTDATRRIVVRQNGNVGIGPSMNPSYLLDVQGDCNVEGVYRIDGAPIATGAAAQTPWLSNIDAAGYTLTNTGNVGIGTASPVERLSVLGPANGYSASFTDATQSTLRILHSSVEIPNGLLFETLGVANIGFRLNNALRMTIRETGNVGIGTANPIQPLTVHVGTDRNLWVQNPAGGVPSIPGNAVLLNAANDAGSANIPMGFYATQFSFGGGGVGIGTATPTTTLHVIGVDSAQLRLSDQTTYHYTIGRRAADGWLVFTGNQDGFNGYEFFTGGGGRSCLRIQDNGEINMSSLPTTNPASSSKKIWCDVANGKVLKWDI